MDGEDIDYDIQAALAESLQSDYKHTGNVDHSRKGNDLYEDDLSKALSASLQEQCRVGEIFQQEHRISDISDTNELDAAIAASLAQADSKLSSEETANYKEFSSDKNTGRLNSSDKETSKDTSKDGFSKYTETSSSSSLPPSSSTGAKMSKFLNKVKGYFDLSNLKQTFDDSSSRNRCVVCGLSFQNGENFLVVLNNNYHKHCFLCAACEEIIHGQYNETNGMYYHPNCAEEIFSPRCTVCCNALVGNYSQHNFFENEKYCYFIHDNERTCYSCSRVEPKASTGKEMFVDLLDGRSLCVQCSNSVIMDSSEANEIYQSVVNFMEFALGLKIPAGMRNTHILAVDLYTLNENLTYNNINYHIENKEHIRGITLSRVGEIRHMERGSINLQNGVLNLTPTTIRIDKIREVSAVCVLYGMPRDLAASILAHEALHVYFNLSKDYSAQLESKVEEGLCQLIAYKYLQKLTEDDLMNQVRR